MKNWQYSYFTHLKQKNYLRKDSLDNQGGQRSLLKPKSWLCFSSKNISSKVWNKKYFLALILYHSLHIWAWNPYPLSKQPSMLLEFLQVSKHHFKQCHKWQNILAPCSCKNKFLVDNVLKKNSNKGKILTPLDFLRSHP